MCTVFPVKISTFVEKISELCPQTSQPFKDTVASTIYDAFTNIVHQKVNMDSGPVCSCSGKDWTKVADVNMTNTNQQCPTNWNLYSSNGIRGCGRRSSTYETCDSFYFLSIKVIPECVERSRPDFFFNHCYVCVPWTFHLFGIFYTDFVTVPVGIMGS